jgi:hypothetical protein
MAMADGRGKFPFMGMHSGGGVGQLGPFHPQVLNLYFFFLLLTVKIVRRRLFRNLQAGIKRERRPAVVVEATEGNEGSAGGGWWASGER